jgi:hypothetical protein
MAAGTEILITNGVTLVAAVFASGIVNMLITRRFTLKDKNDLVREALKYLMRDSLTRYLRELVADGEASDADKQYAESWHDLYKKFGWNGQLDPLMNQVRALPIERSTHHE